MCIKTEGIAAPAVRLPLAVRDDAMNLYLWGLALLKEPVCDYHGAAFASFCSSMEAFYAEVPGLR